MSSSMKLIVKQIKKSLANYYIQFHWFDRCNFTNIKKLEIVIKNCEAQTVNPYCSRH